MKTMSHRLNTAKCKFCLPYFEAETKDEAMAVKLMNRFTQQLEEKISSYAEDTSCGVRTYSTNYSVDHSDSVTTVHILLSARILTSSGKMRPCQREIVCHWRGSRLISVNSI